MKIEVSKKFKLLKFIFVAVGLFYALVWVLQFVNADLYSTLNKIFHTLPDFFNNLLGITIKVGTRSILAGYLYTALFFGLVGYATYEIELHFVEFKKDEVKESYSKPFLTIPKKEKQPKKEKPTKKEKQETKKQNKEQNIKPEPKLPQGPLKLDKQEQEGEITAFYGLMTFVLKNLDDTEIDPETQKLLKYEYSKIIVEKLKQKYEQVDYAVSDKVFFICNEASLFNLFVRDIVKLNKILANINVQQNIKTALKISFWSSPKAKPKKACAILVKINKLNYLNKIIVSKHIRTKFDKQLIKCFDFCPLGEVKLKKTNPNERDILLELFYLKTLDS